MMVQTESLDILVGRCKYTNFYPPHHLTMGEGGSVNIVNDQTLNVIAESFRDWGRVVGVQVVSIILAIKDSAGNWENF